MATIPLPERNAAIDGLFRVAGEDQFEAAHILRFLDSAFTGFDWHAILRQRAPLWQPYAQTGLDLAWWLDEVERLTAELAVARAG